MTPLPRGLKTLTHVVRWGALAGALGYLLANLFLWWPPELVRELAVTSLTEGAGGAVTLDGRARLLGALGSLPRLGLGLFAMWQLWSVFGHYAAGRFFDRATSLQLRHFAWAVLLWAVLAPLERTWTVLALTWGNPPGDRRLLVSLGSGDYQAMLMGAVLLAIASVLAEAVRLAEENEGFV